MPQSENHDDVPSDPIIEEASSFNSIIKERILHGFIPDLRLCQKCDYFYNNSWRHPEYVKLDFGQIAIRIINALKTAWPKKQAARILEVGCGSGYMSLELARAGHDILGIDVSAESIKVAMDFAEKDPWRTERGRIRYLTSDFLTGHELNVERFDAILFVGTLHHFKDQEHISKRVIELLAEDGIIIAHEPTRDRITIGLIEFIFLIRLLLSVGGGFYEKINIPQTEEEHRMLIQKLYAEMKCETVTGEKIQSYNDNEAGYREMHGMLTDVFETLIDTDTYSFFHETIGGLRFDEKTNLALARYLRDTDAFLVKQAILPATEFFFCGRKRSI